MEEGEVPDSLVEKIQELRHEIMEAAVEHDDALLEKYLGGEELTEEELTRVIRSATISGKLFPVFCGSAFKNKGIRALLDGVIDYLPSPLDVPPILGHLPQHDETQVAREASDDAPFSALAFKIMTDSFVGKLTYVRVYSGSLPAGSYVLNASKNRKASEASRWQRPTMWSRERGLSELQRRERGSPTALRSLRGSSVSGTPCGMSERPGSSDVPSSGLRWRKPDHACFAMADSGGSAACLPRQPESPSGPPRPPSQCVDSAAHLPAPAFPSGPSARVSAHQLGYSPAPGDPGCSPR